MEILGNPRFSAMILCLAISVFSITLNGHFRKNMGDALFGFLGLAWLTVSIVVFLVFGWKIGLLCLVGSYCLGMVASPVSGMIVGLLRRDFTREDADAPFFGARGTRTRLEPGTRQFPKQGL